MKSIANPTKDVIIVTGDTTIYQGYAYGNSYYQDFGFINVSKDGGKTWKGTVLDSNSYVTCLSMTDENNGIALKKTIHNMYYIPKNFNDTLIVTNDCWESFSKVILPLSIKNSQLMVSLSTEVIFIMCYSSTEKKNYLYKSFDLGKNWDKVVIPGSIKTLSLINKDEVWACGSESLGKYHLRPVIFKSKNGFADYTTYYPSTENLLSSEEMLIDISFADSKNGITVGSSCNILRTEDGGDTWIQEDLPYIKGLSLKYDYFNQVKMLDSDLAFVTGANSMVLKYEGEKILSSPRFKKFDNAIDINNIPIVFSVIRDAEKYHLQVAKNNTQFYNTTCYETDLVLDTIVSTGKIDTITSENIIVIQKADYGSTYYARVKAINSKTESQWSESAPLFWTFPNDSFVLAPKFIHPTEYEKFTSDKLVFSWLSCGDGFTYDFQVDSEGYWSNILVDSTNISDTTIDISNRVKAIHDFYVRVRVHPAEKKSNWTYSIFSIVSNTGVENIQLPEENQFIFPNPSSDFIEITKPSEGWEPSEGSANSVRIFNVFGEEILKISDPNNSQFSIPNSQLRIDVSGLPSGVYFVRIGDKVSKFIKI